MHFLAIFAYKIQFIFILTADSKLTSNLFEIVRFVEQHKSFRQIFFFGFDLKSKDFRNMPVCLRTQQLVSKSSLTPAHNMTPAHSNLLVTRDSQQDFTCLNTIPHTANTSNHTRFRTEQFESKAHSQTPSSKQQILHKSAHNEIVITINNLNNLG